MDISNSLPPTLQSAGHGDDDGDDESAVHKCKLSVLMRNLWLNHTSKRNFCSGWAFPPVSNFPNCAALLQNVHENYNDTKPY